MEIIKNTDQSDETSTFFSQEEVESLNKVLSLVDEMSCDNSDDVTIQSKIEDKILTLFKSLPKLKKICKDSNNKLFISNFKTYEFKRYGKDQDLIDKFNKKVRNLKYIINLCGSNLTKLDISAYNFSDIMPLIKTNCPNIEELSLKFKVIDSKDFDNVFSNMSHLEDLMINWDCELTLPDTLVKSLEQVGGTLKELQLSYNSKRNEICLPNSLALVFPQLVTLEELAIYFFDVNQSLIDSIGEIKSLIKLKLLYPRVNDSNFNKNYDMYPIGNLKNIQLLHIECINGVTDEFLINLSNNAKNLRSLKITGTYVTDNGVIALNNFNELTYLDFHPNSSSEIEMKFITDKSIECLFNKNLNTLNLTNCIEITNDLMFKLVHHLPNLNFLLVKNTKVTDDVVQKILEIRENFYIINPKYNAHDNDDDKCE